MCAGQGGVWDVPGRRGRQFLRASRGGAWSGPDRAGGVGGFVCAGAVFGMRWAAWRKNRLHFCRGFAILYKFPQRAAPGGVAYRAVVAQLDLRRRFSSPEGG